MNKYLAIINIKTFITVFISILTTYFSYHFNISYNIELTLVSIAIVFPLVFSIKSSFRRREKALEHLSQFRGSLKTVHYFFLSSSTLSPEKHQEITSILEEISQTYPFLILLVFNSVKLALNCHRIKF